MADKYTLTPQLEGIYRGEPTTGIKILDFLQGKRRWPKGRVISDSPYEGRAAGKLSGLDRTYLRKKKIQWMKEISLPIDPNDFKQKQIMIGVEMLMRKINLMNL